MWRLPGYQPLSILQGYIQRAMSALSNLAFFPLTVPKAAKTSAGQLVSLVAIQRSPVDPATQWNTTLSTQLADWYSPVNSSRFFKQELQFSGAAGRQAVWVDASEWGELLALAGAPYLQGVEVPAETSNTTDDICGQAATYPFYVRYNTAPQSPAVDHGVPNPSGLSFNFQNYSWAMIWTYRRSLAAAGSTIYSASPPEVSNQNWGGGNDYDAGYVFLDGAATRAQVTSGSWVGGMNLTALAAAEQLAFGWYRFLKAQANSTFRANSSLYLSLAADVAGTLHGLSKVPYMRDTRRSIGLAGFRLYYNATQPGQVRVYSSPCANLSLFHSGPTRPAIPSRTVSAWRIIFTPTAIACRTAPILTT
jgi:hypothetical protein